MSSQAEYSDDPEESKFAKKSEPRWWAPLLPAAISGVVAAVLALAGNALIFVSKAQDREIQLLRLQAEIESKAQDRELQLLQLRAENIDALRGSYEVKYHTMKTIGAVHGIDLAVRLELPFRSGATIRALEDLMKDPEASPEEESNIRSTLKPVKRVIFVDSMEENNIYCPELKEYEGVTNIDDFVETIIDLPIRIVARKVGEKSDDTPESIERYISEEKPDVVVIHLGAFDRREYREHEKDAIDVDKIVTFLSNIYDEGIDESGESYEYFPEVIIYSREPSRIRTVLKGDSSKDYQWPRDRITILQMRGEICAATDPYNAKQISDALERAINVRRLYTRHF